ncbi:hypothetical protein BDV10DRAFT_48176 [Aspergillus recurvatus]
MIRDSCVPETRSHEIAVIAANEPAVTSEISTSCTVIWDSMNQCRYASSQFFRWLSDRWADYLETYGNPRSPPQDSLKTSKKPEQKSYEPSNVKMGSNKSEHPIENKPCRACQRSGVECDLRRPRCSPCLDEQILCFYVAPLRRTMACSKKQRSTCM